MTTGPEPPPADSARERRGFRSVVTAGDLAQAAAVLLVVVLFLVFFV